MAEPQAGTDLEALIRRIISEGGADDKTVAAVAGLGQDAVPVLLGLLVHENWYVLYAAIRALVLIGEPVVPKLRRLAFNKSCKIFWPAAFALEQKWHLEHIPAATFLEVFKNSNPVMRYLAVKALGRRNDQSVAPSLIELLSHEKRSIRDCAASALAHMGRTEGLPHLIDYIVQVGGSRFPAICQEGLYALGDASFPALSEALDSTEWRTHLNITNYLAELSFFGTLEISKRSKVLPLLCKVLKNPEDPGFVTAPALGVIGMWGIREAVPILAEYLQGSDTSLAETAARALEKIETPEAAAVLAEWRADQARDI